MKRYLIITLLCGLWACNEGAIKKFEVTGKIHHSPTTVVYLEEIHFSGSQPVIVDSGTIAKDGSFHLEATSTGESLYSIRTAGRMFPVALIINDAPKITIEADVQNQAAPYTVKGSDATQALIEYDRNLSHRAISIYQMSTHLDSIARKRIEDTTARRQYSQIEAAVADVKDYAITFMKKSKSPALTLYALESYQSMMSNLGLRGLNDTEVTDIVQTAADKHPKSRAIAEAQQKLRPSKAPDFTLPDVNGNQVSLSSFQGKYVLVDFWASWCQPCRRENPNVVRAYQQFKDKNFTILGVSLDQKRDPWLQAIKDDQLTWTHISDLQYWNSSVVELFGFNSIPYNILVDPKGNIIAEDLRGEELMNKLKQVLR